MHSVWNWKGFDTLSFFFRWFHIFLLWAEQIWINISQDYFKSIDLRILFKGLQLNGISFWYHIVLKVITIIRQWDWPVVFTYGFGIVGLRIYDNNQVVYSIYLDSLTWQGLYREKIRITYIFCIEKTWKKCFTFWIFLIEFPLESWKN